MRALLQKIFKPSALPVAAQPLKPPAQSCAELKKQGNAHLAEGRLVEAGQCYADAVAADPADALALVNLGYVLLEQKRLLQAQAALEKAIALDATLHDPYYMLAMLAQTNGDAPRAIQRFQQTLKAEPNFEPAYRELGYELAYADRTDEAEQVLAEGVRRFPESSDLLCNLGNLYCLVHAPEKAIAAYETALSFRPDNSDVLSNLASALFQIGDSPGGKVVQARALELNPNDASIQTNAATMFHCDGQFGKALDLYRSAIAIEPDLNLAHFGLGLCCLLLGNFKDGWAEYQWRFEKDKQITLTRRKSFPQPLWLGDFSIKDKTILLHCEQGYGDTLQFCRYAADVAALGARVVLQVQRGLKEVLDDLPGVHVLIDETEALPRFDCHCALLSLPLALGHKEGVVSGTQPYLNADAQLKAGWQQRLQTLHSKRAPRIGIVWSGNADHARDKERSIALSEFLQCLPAGLQAICLQPQVRDSDQASMASEGRISFVGQELKTFADTAALISCLDLVVTIDTSVAHLAGALGVPVWVLVTHVPDWRWQLGRSDSPWYASARLFRQAEIGQWQQPLQEVHDALVERSAIATPQAAQQALPTITP